MSLYTALTQVLAPYAAKINGLLTGWNGTVYSTPGEAVRQQIADLHVLIGDAPGRAISASAISYGESDVETALDGVNDRLERQQGIIAEAFSVQSTYNVGDSVIYEAGLYTFKANKTAGAWDATKVDGPFKVTNELSSLKSDLNRTEDEIIRTAGIVEEMECGLTDDVKTALLACFENVAWIGADGQIYYDALENALNHSRVISSISAVFSQGSAVIYDTDEIYALKQYLTVTVTYSDGTTKEVNNYTLSGKLVAGTSTITVAYNKKTTTFNVTVTHQVKTLESISATFSSSAVITTDDVLDDLRPYLTVRASYSDGATNTITNYALSGSLNVGANTITVTYNGKTATFTVNVTQAEKTLQSISAVFNQGSAVIYADSALSDLKPYLTVTARYSDGTTQTVTSYTLSGTLTTGTSTITASYSEKTATFNVTVSPVETPKRYIVQGDIASHIGIPSINVSNGTISETSPTTFSCVVFDQSIEKMWFNLHTHLDSRRRPRYIFRKDADGSFYAIDENTTSPKLYKFTLDTGGTKYNATQISDISSVTTFTKTGDYFSTLKKEMNISNGILTITDADSSVSFTNANCFGYWQAAYNSNISAGMFDECEVEADE